MTGVFVCAVLGSCAPAQVRRHVLTSHPASEPPAGTIATTRPASLCDDESQLSATVYRADGTQVRSSRSVGDLRVSTFPATIAPFDHTKIGVGRLSKDCQGVDEIDVYDPMTEEVTTRIVRPTSSDIISACQLRDGRWFIDETNGGFDKILLLSPSSVVTQTLAVGSSATGDVAVASCARNADAAVVVFANQQGRHLGVYRDGAWFVAETEVKYVNGFDPGGRSVFFYRDGVDPQPLEFDTISRVARTLPIVPVQGIEAWNGQAWSPDGRSIALQGVVAGQDGESWCPYIASASDWTTTDISRLEGAAPRALYSTFLAWSPDSTRLLMGDNGCGGMGGSHGVAVVGLDGSFSFVGPRSGSPIAAASWLSNGYIALLRYSVGR